MGGQKITRTYIPKDSGKTKDYVIKLDRTMILPNVNKEFYHEDINRENQIISGVFDIESSSVQLSFDPKKLMKFLETII